MSLDQINLHIKQAPSLLDIYYVDVNWRFLVGEGGTVYLGDGFPIPIWSWKFDLHMHPLGLAF